MDTVVVVVRVTRVAAGVVVAVGLVHVGDQGAVVAAVLDTVVVVVRVNAVGLVVQVVVALLVVDGVVAVVVDAVADFVGARVDGGVVVVAVAVPRGGPAKRGATKAPRVRGSIGVLVHILVERCAIERTLLVGLAVAVVVEAVADLRRPAIDRGVGSVAVDLVGVPVVVIVLIAAIRDPVAVRVREEVGHVVLVLQTVAVVVHAITQLGRRRDDRAIVGVGVGGVDVGQVRGRGAALLALDGVRDTVCVVVAELLGVGVGVNDDAIRAAKGGTVLDAGEEIDQAQQGEAPAQEPKTLFHGRCASKRDVWQEINKLTMSVVIPCHLLWTFCTVVTRVTPIRDTDIYGNK